MINVYFLRVFAAIISTGLRLFEKIKVRYYIKWLVIQLKECPICSKQAQFYKQQFDGYQVKCPNCGEYEITRKLMIDVEKQENLRLKLSSILRERSLKMNSPIIISKEKFQEGSKHLEYPILTIRELLEGFPETVSERLDRILLNLSRLSKYPGEPISISNDERSLFFSETTESREILFLIEQLVSKNLVKAQLKLPTSLILTVDGWNKVSELESSKSENKKAFVAMWFDEEMDNVYNEAVCKAVEENGFKPIRIDKKEHNNKIDDEIIAEIKTSKFVIADFTGHRGGVYFEAGFAMGLGLSVIWTCREDDLSNLHFDTRQYSHIVWHDKEDLFHKLYNRIRATI